MTDKYFDAVVLARRDLTDRICEFHIGAADNRPLRMAEAGSHIEVRFGGTQGLFLRHYSIVGPLRLDDETERFWRIAVQRENRPRGSSFIHQKFRPGFRFRVSPPISAFRIVRGQPHTLLIAGGIGVTPMVAMARSLRRRRESFSMFYAGLERSGMAYVDELEALCDDRLTIHQSKHQGIPDLSQLLAQQPPGTIAYICGPGPMIDALRKTASELGWTPDRIRFEVFNVSHKPDDGSFDIRLKSGLTYTVGAGTTILDTLELAGVDTLSDCRRGECGLCVTDVAACDGRLDHRDHFFDEAEHASGQQMTICCSRISGHLLELNI